MKDSLVDKAAVDHSLAVLKNEIGKELKIVGERQFIGYVNLTPELVDSATVQQASIFLENLDKFYARRLSKWMNRRDDLIKGLTDTPEKLVQYEVARNRYHNIAIADMVTRHLSIKKISEVGDDLIMVTTPVYHKPDLANWMDYRSTFYAASKGFMGLTFDTLVFNIAMLWFMTIGLIIALYYEWLRKLVDGIGNFQQNRKYRRMLKEADN